MHNLQKDVAVEPFKRGKNKCSNLKLFLKYEREKIWWKETCSCPSVRYFCTLFWDDITIIWDENIFYFLNWEKKPDLDQKKSVY